VNVRVAESFSIGEVAAMIGVTPHTIRAWERRHGVVTDDHRPAGRVRRYSLDDVELLRRIRAGRMVQGLSLKLAVLAATGMLPPSQPAPRGVAGELPRSVDHDGGPWRSVVDSLPHICFIVDDQGRLVDANVNAAKLAAATRESLSGRPFSDFVEPYERAKAAAVCRPPYPSRFRWEVNLRSESGARTYAFECWPIRWRQRTLLVLLGLRTVAPAM
jgi:PAS domain-containing protein